MILSKNRVNLMYHDYAFVIRPKSLGHAFDDGECIHTSRQTPDNKKINPLVSRVYNTGIFKVAHYIDIDWVNR